VAVALILASFVWGARSPESRGWSPGLGPLNEGEVVTSAQFPQQTARKQPTRRSQRTVGSRASTAARRRLPRAAVLCCCARRVLSVAGRHGIGSPLSARRLTRSPDLNIPDSVSRIGPL